MFTGLITHIGQIESVSPLGVKDAGVAVRIRAKEFTKDLSLGDSIAVQGACMTVVQFDAEGFDIHVSAESLKRTVGLNTVGAEVNLEPALRFGDALNGHLVSGHVEAVGCIQSLTPVGESHELRIIVPPVLSPYMVYKGSVTVNGISLTVNQVQSEGESCVISINIIPHTIANTTLRNNQVGDFVNLESDMLAKYMARYLEHLKVRV